MDEFWEAVAIVLIVVLLLLVGGGVAASASLNNMCENFGYDNRITNNGESYCVDYESGEVVLLDSLFEMATEQ